jgi:hypothetical protein
MTIELAACLVCAVVCYPISKLRACHFAAFAALNLALLGSSYAEASTLAAMFAVEAAADMMLARLANSWALAVSAVLWCVLCAEQVLNGDYLLNMAGPLSIAACAMILAPVARGYIAWISGSSRHS